MGNPKWVYNKAYIGGKAAEACEQLGAAAYTQGDKIAFKQPPNLKLAAHEAAHTEHQKEKLALPGGVGKEGDKYEQNADEVAGQVEVEVGFQMERQNSKMKIFVHWSIQLLPESGRISNNGT